MKMQDLVGKTVLSAHINSDKDLVVLETDSGTFYLSWVGECCSNCFLAHVNYSEGLVGQKIIKIEHTEWENKTNESCDVVDSMGTTITTTAGVVSFETRLEHNGYYSGKIQISNQNALNLYGRKRENDADQKLTDF